MIAGRRRRNAAEVLVAADKSSDQKSAPFIQHGSVSPHEAARWHGQPGANMQPDVRAMKATATDERLITQRRRGSTPGKPRIRWCGTRRGFMVRYGSAPCELTQRPL